MPLTMDDLKAKKAHGEKIVMLTCYDAPTALWQDAAGVDVIFVGDSVGTNILGYVDPREVTMADMLHHTRAVRRGVRHAYFMSDLPYGTCDTPEAALANARLLMDAGADGVKLEGMKPEAVRAIADAGIDVCAHLGLNPQIHTKMRMQGKTAESAVELIRDSLALEAAGAKIMVYELVPDEVARAAAERLSIPTIGIGAGANTDGQVLVVTDLLGYTEREFRHNRKYENLRERLTDAFRRYAEDVRSGAFPAEENLRRLEGEELARFPALLKEMGG